MAPCSNPYVILNEVKSRAERHTPVISSRPAPKPAPLAVPRAKRSFTRTLVQDDVKGTGLPPFTPHRHPEPPGEGSPKPAPGTPPRPCGITRQGRSFTRKLPQDDVEGTGLPQSPHVILNKVKSLLTLSPQVSSHRRPPRQEILRKLRMTHRDRYGAIPPTTSYVQRSTRYVRRFCTPRSTFHASRSTSYATRSPHTVQCKGAPKVHAGYFRMRTVVMHPAAIFYVRTRYVTHMLQTASTMRKGK